MFCDITVLLYRFLCPLFIVSFLEKKVISNQNFDRFNFSLAFCFSGKYSTIPNVTVRKKSVYIYIYLSEYEKNYRNMTDDDFTVICFSFFIFMVQMSNLFLWRWAFC